MPSGATAAPAATSSDPKTIRVLMTECVAGIRFVHKPGQEYDLPAAKAEQYMAAGIATRVTDEDTVAQMKARLIAMGYKIGEPPKG